MLGTLLSSLFKDPSSACGGKQAIFVASPSGNGAGAQPGAKAH
jgi:hypothetical protein